MEFCGVERERKTSSTAKRMDGFYGQVNAMNQIDFILAANNTTIMQPFSDTQKPTTRTREPTPSLFFASVSQKQQQNRAWYHQKICTHYQTLSRFFLQKGNQSTTSKHSKHTN